MSCGRVSNLLSAYIDRELSGVEMLHIRRHLSDCAECAAEYEALCRMKMLLGRLGTPSPGPDFVAATVRRFETGATRANPAPFRRPGASMLAAGRGRPHPQRQRFAAFCSRLTPYASHVPWPRVTLCVTTAALAAALVFTSVGLLKPRHADALVATNDVAVVQGIDPHESEMAVDWTPAQLTGFDLQYRDREPWRRLPEPQPLLRWTPVSLNSQGWRGFP